MLIPVVYAQNNFLHVIVPLTLQVVKVVTEKIYQMIVNVWITILKIQLLMAVLHVSTRVLHALRLIFVLNARQPLILGKMTVHVTV